MLQAQRQYVRDLFADPDPRLQWQCPDGTHMSKEEVFGQLLSRPGVGHLTFFNIRSWDASNPFKGARERADNQCTFSGPGSRTCINVRFSEPGGRGFLPSVNSVQSLRRFSPFFAVLTLAPILCFSKLCALLSRWMK